MRIFALTIIGSALLASPLALRTDVSASSVDQPDVQAPVASDIFYTVPTKITPIAIQESIEQSIIGGGYDDFLRTQYDEGVKTAFREAYAINLMHPLWNENSAHVLLDDIAHAASNGIDVSDIKAQAAEAAYARFYAPTPGERARADIDLSLAYIAWQNQSSLQGDRDPNQPRLASLDLNLVQAADNAFDAPIASFVGLDLK